jgi:hypothetical protein
MIYTSPTPWQYRAPKQLPSKPNINSNSDIQIEKTSKIDKNNTKNMIMERETEKKNIQVQL